MRGAIEGVGRDRGREDKVMVLRQNCSHRLIRRFTPKLAPGLTLRYKLRFKRRD
jgi:hypothetical protein